jgi:HEAT repeat protein
VVRRAQELRRTRRRWRWALVGCVLLLASPAAPVWRVWDAKGWGAVPGPALVWLSGWMGLQPAPPSGTRQSFGQALQIEIRRPMPVWEQRLLIRRLEGRLRDEEPTERAMAAILLGWAFDGGPNPELKRSVSALARALDDPDANFNYAVANSLGMLTHADADARGIWIGALAGHSNPDVRATAAAMLGLLARRGDTGVIGPLRAAVNDADPGARAQAVHALGHARDPADLPAFMNALADSDYGVNAAACHAIQRLGSAGAPATGALLTVVDTSGHPSGAWAIIALGRIGPGAREAVPDLLAKMTRPGASQRGKEECAIALGRIGEATPAVIEGLRGLLDDSSAPVFAAALEGLYRLRWAPSGADRERVTRLIEKGPAVRIWGRLLLAQADGTIDHEIDPLIGLLKGQEWWVSEAAIDALGSLGARAERALPALRALCPEPTRGEDGDTDLLRQAAEPAVRQIEGELLRTRH